VVADIGGVINDVPLDVAPNVTVPVPQRLEGVLAVMVGGDAFTVAVTAVLDAVVHVPLVAST
jgi:hypothetical protein